MQLPTSSLWQMAPGSWAEYQKILVPSATYISSNGVVYCNASPAWSVVATFRITNLPFEISKGRWGIARVYSSVGQTMAAVDPTLYNVLFEELWNDGKFPAFIGEGANQGSLDIIPPEPLLTVNPIQGELFTIPSYGRNIAGDVVSQNQFKVQYCSYQVGITFGEAKNATWSTCVENPGIQGQIHVYNQVFDGEIYQQWYGSVNQDNSITNAYLLYRTGKGTN